MDGSANAGSRRILVFIPAISLEPGVNSFIYWSDAQTRTGDEITSRVKRHSVNAVPITNARH
jgi:hypothetical protein